MPPQRQFLSPRLLKTVSEMKLCRGETGEQASYPGWPSPASVRTPPVRTSTIRTAWFQQSATYTTSMPVVAAATDVGYENLCVVGGVGQTVRGQVRQCPSLLACARNERINRQGYVVLVSLRIIAGNRPRARRTLSDFFTKASLTHAQIRSDGESSSSLPRSSARRAVEEALLRVHPSYRAHLPCACASPTSVRGRGRGASA